LQLGQQKGPIFPKGQFLPAGEEREKRDETAVQPSGEKDLG